MYRFFIKEDLSKYDLSSIEYSTTAGEALNPEVYEQWKRATGLSIYEGFGQTETTLSIYNPVGSVPKSGSMGIPSPLYDVDLILPDGTPAPVGETGKIVIRTAKHTPCGLFMGYYLSLIHIWSARSCLALMSASNVSFSGFFSFCGRMTTA